jgi:hypothetical protein
MTNGMRLIVVMEPYSGPFYQRMAESGIPTARGKSDRVGGVMRPDGDAPGQLTDGGGGGGSLTGSALAGQ